MSNADRMPGWRPRQLTPLRTPRSNTAPRFRFASWRSALRHAGATLRAAVAAEEVVIRPSGTADRLALDRLGQLDGRAVARGPYVVAEVDGELVAAVPVEGGEALADPFRPTDELVSLLELRAGQLRPALLLAA